MHSAKNIEISICIPTCNQQFDLFQTLRSFKNQNIDNIEIIIRDDSINNIENEIYKNFPHLPISYYNMGREGIDVAVIWLINKAIGNYIWILGDDILEDYSIDKIQSLLFSYKPCLVYLNSECLETNIKSFDLPKYIGDDKNLFLSNIKDQMGFCSAIIMKSSIIGSININKFDKHIGTCWITLYIALLVLSRSKTIIYDNNIFFKSKYKPPGEIKWYDPYLIHCIYYKKVLTDVSKEFDKYLIKRLISDKYYRSLKAVFSERAKGFSTGYASRGNKIFVTLISYGQYPITYPILLLFLLPNKIIKYLYDIYKYFTK